MDYTDETLSLQSGLQVSTRRWGAGEMRVLALHGWLDNVGSFDSLAPLFQGTTVVAVDLPGHGQSEWRARDAAYHYVDWLPVVYDTLDALGWDEVILLGHSMGAGVSALFAGVFPTRVSRLVLLEGLGPYSTAPGPAVDNLRRAIEARSVHLSREPRLMPDLTHAVNRKLSALPYLDEAVARALVTRGTRPSGDGIVFSHDPRLTGRSLLRLTEPQVLQMLGAITAPTLVITATEGLQYPEDAADLPARTAALSTAQTVEVAGHHHVHATHPERVVEYIQRFLNESAV